MLESMKSNVLEYQKLSADELAKRGILGRLVGIIADTKNPTRNGRLYSKELWEHVFDDPIMKEKIETRNCYGELGHPEDGRFDIDPTKIAICLAEVPKIDSNGCLLGVFDILATPNGKILKTLLDYGSLIGVSSRGEGEILTDVNGDEYVDPESYDCSGWDAVLIPAVKSARPNYVAESLNSNKKLTEALRRSVAEASLDDLAIMKETLKSLNILFGDTLTENVNHNSLSVYDTKSTDKLSDNINVASSMAVPAAGNIGADNLVELLLSVLLTNFELEQKVTILNEKLSVCYAKDADVKSLSSEVDSLRELLSNESNARSVLKQQNRALQNLTENQKTNLEDKASLIESLLNKLSKCRTNNSLLQSLLNESIALNDELLNRIANLSKTLVTCKKDFASERSTLSESIDSLKKDSLIKHKDYASKLESLNASIEKYKKIAELATNKYIDCLAKMLGVAPQLIKSQLGNKFSFTDIDTICEELRERTLNINNLNFNPANKTPVNIIKESTLRMNKSNTTGLDFSDDYLDPDSYRDLEKLVSLL